MLNRKNSKFKQDKMILSTINDLMPKEHFLRDLDRLVNFDFIYEKVETLYSTVGRRSIDPVVIMKMLLLGYLYGINSERKIEQECIVNIAYRWFLGLDFEDKIPDHSTISQLRRRKFKDSDIFQEIFDAIVRQCIEKGLVSGELLLTDSTHIKANVDNNLRETIIVEDKPSKYIQKLDEMAISEGLVNEKKDAEIKTKEIIKSKTDPDSGILNRPSKPKGFYYLDHQTSDSKNGIITDVFATPANVSDNVPHTERIIEQIEKFNFETKAICGDSGYYSGEIHKEMYDRNIKTYIPIINNKNVVNDDDYTIDDFKYDEENDCFICPNGKKLTRKSYRLGKGLVGFASKSSDCTGCQHKEKCIKGKSGQKSKTISKAYNFAYTIKQNENVDTDEYFEAMRLRKIWAEGNFSHQKANHNLNNLKKRGIKNVLEHCLFSATALNLKRMVKLLKNTDGNLFNSWISSVLIFLEKFEADFYTSYRFFSAIS